MDRDLQVMMSRVARLGEMSESEAHRIVNQVYEDGIVSRGEAEALFRLNGVLAHTDPAWTARFIEAVKDYVLTREPPQGQVTEEEADWLIARVSNDDAMPSLDEIDLLLAVLRYANGAADNLGDFTIRAISNHIKFERVVRPLWVERMRQALYAPRGAGGVWVTQTEARILFEINDAVAFAKNAPAWNDLFARAIGNHLLARAHPSPQTEEEALARELWLSDQSSGVGSFFGRMGGAFGDGWFEKVTHDSGRAARARMIAADAALRAAIDVTLEENTWLMKRLGWDAQISPAERALLDFLKAEAPGFAQGLAVAA
jgi:hypothetical protein